MQNNFLCNECAAVHNFCRDAPIVINTRMGRARTPFDISTELLGTLSKLKIGILLILMIFQVVNKNYSI